MKQKAHIHIFGASGSGTTTIAKSVCGILGYEHFDSDNYFWLPTKDPFTIERSRDECMKLMQGDLSRTPQWILSGSITGWGDILITHFDLVVFVYVPQDIRLKRLKKREYERYGHEILPGRSKYAASQNFLAWAAAYDIGTKSGRSLLKHETWLHKIKCPVLKIVNDNLEVSVKEVLNAIRK